jgi:glycosyltransferase involved in cell wall biosynthesis
MTSEAETSNTAAGAGGTAKRLKVALVVGRSRLAGTERHVLELARAFDPKKVEATVVVFSEGLLVQKLREAGIDVHVLKRRARFDPLLLSRMVRYFRANAFDVVHGHPERIACLAGKLAGVPAVLMTYHLVGPQSAGVANPSALLVLAEKARASVVDLTIAVSRPDANFLIRRFGRDPSTVRYIANGIDTRLRVRADRSILARRLNIDPAVPLVFTAARLSPQKGIRYLVEGMKKVLEDFPRAVLLIAGEGELEEDLRRLASRLNVSSNVVFSGYREDVLELMSVSDVFVLPSLWEGMPYAILEAMLLAKPVVTTTVCSEVVTDGETGFVVPPADSAALAGAVSRLLARPELASRMGLRGEERLERCFSASRMAGQTLEVYEQLLSARKSSATGQKQSFERHC